MTAFGDQLFNSGSVPLMLNAIQAFSCENTASKVKNCKEAEVWLLSVI
jgi:hypothetical protein